MIFPSYQTSEVVICSSRSTSSTWWVLSFRLAVDVSCQLLEVTLVKLWWKQNKGMCQGAAESTNRVDSNQVSLCNFFEADPLTEVCWIDVRHAFQRLVFRQQVKVHGSKRYIMISFLHHHAFRDLAQFSIECAILHLFHQHFGTFPWPRQGAVTVG